MIEYHPLRRVRVRVLFLIISIFLISQITVGDLKNARKKPTYNKSPSGGWDVANWPMM